MASEYKLSITPVNVTELPPPERVLEEGRALIESTHTSNWRLGKVYHKIVKTSARAKAPGEPAGWYCRVSEHGPEDASFDELWEKIGIDKANNEIHYVEEVKKATLIKEVSPSQTIWSMYYRFSPPVSPRVFTVMQTIQLNDASPRSGIIVSIPVDLSADPSLAKLEEKGVKARYVSVELLQELPDGKLEWRMATSSRAEGLIPQFLTERAMPGSISHDVTGLLKWIHSSKSQKQKEVQQQPEPAQPPMASDPASTAAGAENMPAVVPPGPSGAHAVA